MKDNKPIHGLIVVTLTLIFCWYMSTQAHPLPELTQEIHPKEKMTRDFATHWLKPALEIRVNNEYHSILPVEKDCGGALDGSYIKDGNIIFHVKLTTFNYRTLRRIINEIYGDKSGE